MQQLKMLSEHCVAVSFYRSTMRFSAHAVLRASRCLSAGSKGLSALVDKLTEQQLKHSWGQAQDCSVQSITLNMYPLANKMDPQASVVKREVSTRR